MPVCHLIHMHSCTSLAEVLTIDALVIIREYDKVQHILQRFGDEIMMHDIRCHLSGIHM